MNQVKLALVVVALAAALGLPGHGQEPKKVGDLMKRKLELSQKVLEGIALNDFDKIGKHGGELIQVSKEAEWKALKTARYELYSNEFRRTAEALVESAKDKSLDGAALAYVDLTLTCVKCHKHVREVRQTRNDSPSGPAGRGGRAGE